MKAKYYLLAAVLAGGAALANSLVQETTATVTAPLVGNVIGIDGRNYTIPVNPANRDQLAALNVGDQVDLGYTGSASAHNMRVLSVAPHREKGQ